MKLTDGQILAINHVQRHSLSKPMSDCRACKRLRKKLGRGVLGKETA